MLKEVLKKHNQWVSIAKQICNNPIDAEDIVQDMYLKLHSINKEINDSYIRMIIRNLVYDLTKKKSKFVSIDSGNKDYTKILESKEDIKTNLTSKQEIILKKVNRLNEKDKELIIDSSNMSIRDVAEKHNLCYVYVFRELKRIKNKLKE